MFSSASSRSIPRDHDLEKHNRGFTLVELLIVIVVLGILAAITVFAVGGITSKAKTTACQADTSILNTAIEAYNAGEQVYPASLTAMNVKAPVTPVSTGGAIYLKTLPSNMVNRFGYDSTTGLLKPTSLC